MALMRNFAWKTELQGPLQGLFSKDQDKDKDLSAKDQDQDFSSRTRTRTRTNITGKKCQFSMCWLVMWDGMMYCSWVLPTEFLRAGLDPRGRTFCPNTYYHSQQIYANSTSGLFGSEKCQLVMWYQSDSSWHRPHASEWIFVPLVTWYSDSRNCFSGNHADILLLIKHNHRHHTVFRFYMV